MRAPGLNPQNRDSDFREVCAMEIMLVFLSTAIGTVAGVIVAAVMMQRKIRVSGAGMELALKTQLQNTEWALASAGRDVEELRKQLEVREQAGQQAREE